MTDAQTYDRVQAALQDLKFLAAPASLDALAQQAATSAEHTAAQSQDLERVADALQQSISAFKI